jgi:hypothetical protein
MMRYSWASKAVVMADPMPPRAPVIKAIFFILALPAKDSNEDFIGFSG